MIRLIDFTCQINNFLFLFSISFFEIERIFGNGNVFFLKKHIKKKTIDIEYKYNENDSNNCETRKK